MIESTILLADARKKPRAGLARTRARMPVALQRLRIANTTLPGRIAARVRGDAMKSYEIMLDSWFESSSLISCLKVGLIFDELFLEVLVNRLHIALAFADG